MDLAFRCMAPFSILVLALQATLFGCSSGLERKVEQLQKDIARLEDSGKQLNKDLSQRDAELNRVRLELKDKDALLVAVRMGIVDPSTDLFATLDTSMGLIIIKLYWREAPHTVQNFVELAEGTREWTDPATGRKVRRRLYDGLTFHRVVAGFMIQGGDPAGDGRGGPGYRLPDEIVPGLSHDRPGIVSMANSGPDTNGSQFFILVAPTPRLDEKHTMFGEVVEGLEVANAIAAVRTDDKDRPVDPVLIKRVRIGRGAPPR